MSEHIRWEHGKLLKSISLAGYDFTETAYSPEFDLSPHSHNFIYYCFVLQGNFSEISNNRKSVHNPLSLIFHPLEEVHSNHFYTKSRCFNIQFSADKFRQFDSQQTVLERAKSFENGKIINLASNLYQELCSVDKFSHLTVEGLMLEVLAETFRQSEKVFSKKPPRWLKRIKNFIDEEFTENLTIEDLANSENIHPVHLAKEFRRFFKTTIGDHIRRKRLELACQKLIASKTPIKEIALETGFFDQSHFTRVFKKAFNITPSVYRQFFSNR